MNLKNILIINGHPDTESFNFALSKAYKKGALESGAKVKEIIIRDIEFNSNLEFGYRKRIELEPDLVHSQEKIKWADHIVWIYPVWWGSYPAIMKGFIDRTFLPGFAFEYRSNSVWWDKKLKRKSARIISTLHQPTWYYKLNYLQPSTRSIKWLTLHYCGINPVKTTTIGGLKNATQIYRANWLAKVENLGLKNK